MSENSRPVKEPGDPLPGSSKRVVTWLWKPRGDLPEFTTQYGVEYVRALLTGLGRNLSPPWRLELWVDENWMQALRLWLEVHPEFRFTDRLRLIPITEPMVGWAHMMEIFHPDHRPGQGERVLALGLDSIIVGNCDWLFEWDQADCGWIRDPLDSRTISNSVMTYDRNGAMCLWDIYQEAKREKFPKWCRMFDQPSEMMIMREHFSKYIHPLLNEDPPENGPRLLSYKVQTNQGVYWPGWDVSVVYFHGSPKPHELPETNPLRQLWHPLPE